MGSEEKFAAEIKEDSDLIFALDIGTRSVIGIVGVAEKGTLQVLAMEERLHTHRAVIDGQIEDIAQTALIAQQVKERLEQKIGVALHEVCIAAAGRLLKTQQTEFEIELDEKESIQQKQIMELETGAIQQCYDLLWTEELEKLGMDFLCVGHSVVNYWLDGYEMSTLLDHRGKRAKAKVIATFLPSAVVESLYAVMMKIGLTVTSMTLEPIAAMNAVIPRELRMLNLALVDIGGGTSDIALSEGGSVIAYTMATVAGDEITEAIMRECLVDFDVAEQMKLELSKNPRTILYQDILGFGYEIPQEELMEKIRPTVEQLAGEISTRILEANGKSPAAVFLVGGGCQIPALCSIVAEKLGIDEKKVAVGGNNYMKRMIVTDLDISGPEFATPVGIAVTAVSTRLEKGFTATVNGKKITLLRSGASTVLELLMMSGCQYNQIIGRSGASVVYELNGERKVARGGHATPAEVRVNGMLASVSTPVQPDDEILFQPARSGVDASPTVGSEIRRRQVRLVLGGSEQLFSTRVWLGGAPAEDSQPIHGGDQVTVQDFSSAKELFAQMNLDSSLFSFRINGGECDAAASLNDGDLLEALPRAIRPAPPKREEPENPVPQETPPPAEEGKAVPPPAPEPEAPPPPSLPEKRVLHIRLNDKPMQLLPKPDGTPYQFLDMLNFVNIDFSNPQGNIILELNGKSASYLDLIHEGDWITIQWDSSTECPRA